MKPRLLHLVPLDTVGGVEQLYSFFISSTTDRFTHITLNDRKHIAPMLRDNIESASSVVYSTKLKGNFPIPKKPSFFRRLHLRKILQDSQPHLIVVWNKVEGFDLDLVPHNVKVIYYEHGAGWYSPTPKQAKRFLSEVDGIICNSQAAAEIIKEKWSIPDSVPRHVCHNCIRKDCFPEHPIPHKRLKNPPYTLGIAGRLISRKGIPIALHCMKQLQQDECMFRLLVAGTGPEQNEFARLAETLGISQYVEFLGLVSDMSSFYQRIDAFLCPSVTEPFGLVAAEAGAYGVPVIASAVDGLPEVISDGRTGVLVPPSLSLAEYEALGGQSTGILDSAYFPMENSVSKPKVISPESLAKSIKGLFQNAETYEAVSRQSGSYTRERFHPTKYIRELSNLFSAYIQQ